MTDFTDRASYLTFRAAWKAQYADLTQDIRQTRQDIKTATVSQQSILQMEKARMRNEATVLLKVRAEAKVEAQRQYLAEREARLAA